MRAVDTTRAPHNVRDLRRNPLPLSRATSRDFRWFLACLGCVAAGVALGVVGYAWAALHGLLP